MDVFWQELTLGLPEIRELVRVLIRIVASALLGALIGLQREKAGKPAGLRTHILVSLGTTVFVLGCVNYGMSSDGLSRVIQGIVTGIGFVGAGSILKLDEERDIRGLTTAAGIWMTSAIGVIVGLGELGLAIISTVITLIVLGVVSTFELHHDKPSNSSKSNDESNKN